MKLEAVGFPELHKALLAATDSLRLNASLLDRLNVFPVPDGDTGANLLSTLQPGVSAVGSSGCSSVPDLFTVLTEQANRNSRGNSGFILARFLSGLSEAVADNPSIRADTLARGFAGGSYLARSSLLAPVEGTMITIIAAMAEAIAGSRSACILERLGCALECGRRKIFDTPRLLPMLARAGVVDAGGLGFIVFVDGLLRGLTDRQVALEPEADYRFAPSGGSAPQDPARLTFRYCTELTVQKRGDASTRELTRFLQANGDSVALFDENQILKLHIHCDVPERILAEAEKLGTVLRAKVDDMAEQLNQGLRDAQEHERLAVLAVIPGPGFEEIFKQLEADEVLLYAERLPSAGEILEALGRVQADHVILLPNEKNVVPAAMMARQSSGKNVFVLPTENVVQGITALYNYNAEDSPQSNMSNMGQSLGLARCLRVYQSNRQAQFGELSIRRDDFFVAEADAVLAAAPSLTESLRTAFSKLDLSQKASIGVYCGQGLSDDFQAELQELTRRLREENGHLEVEQHFAGQRGCALIISVE